MVSRTKLSIIIPVYNEADKIHLALESVLYQRIDYPFEVIVVDDGSTDSTIKSLEPYQKAFDNILVIRHPENLGKGAAFRTAYAKACGEYFHVLDADDFFISYDKLQKQIEILDKHPEVVAVAHNTIILHPDTTIEILNNDINAIDHSYEDCINFHFYHHTSSYMFRKIVTELPAEFANVKALRGDSACFYFHTFKSKKGIKYIPDISSVYNFHGSGLWSGLNAIEKNEFNKELFRALQNSVICNSTSAEHILLDTKLAQSFDDSNEAANDVGNRLRLETIMQVCMKVASRVYEKENYEKMFSGLHGLMLIDQLCECVGRILMIQSNYKIVGRKFDSTLVAFLVPGLNPKGGGVFAEILDLIQIHLAEGKRILIVVSGMAEIDHSQIGELINHAHITICFISGFSLIEKTQKIVDTLYSAAPIRLYTFISHHDVVACAATQKGLAHDIVMDYVYDHGSTLGLSNSSIDKIIFKCTQQINAVAHVIPSNKILLIPPLMRAKFNVNPYRPLKAGKITTACAAARAYKIEMKSEFDYCEVIASVLKKTKGKHYHFGPISKVYYKKIIKNLRHQNVSIDHFVHIPFADNLSLALNEAGVDLFITPFPIPSIRITLEVMSCGIPLLCFKANNTILPNALDLFDSTQYSWANLEDVDKVIKSLTADSLLSKSISLRSYFDAHNNYFNNNFKILKLESEDFVINDNTRSKLIDIIENRLYKIDDFENLLQLSHVFDSESKFKKYLSTLNARRMNCFLMTFRRICKRLIGLARSV